MYIDTIGALLVNSYSLNSNNYYRVKADQQQRKGKDQWLQANRTLSERLIKAYNDWFNVYADLEEISEIDYLTILAELQYFVNNSVGFSADTTTVPGDVMVLNSDAFNEASLRLDQFYDWLKEDIEQLHEEDVDEEE